MSDGAGQLEGRGSGVETLLSRVLTAGVLVAAATMLVGGAMLLVSRGNERPALGVFAGQPAGLTHPAEISQGAADLDPASIVQLGVLCLIATPVARVAFALVIFAIRRDRLYVLVTLLVLAALGLGLWGGVS